MIFNSVSYLLFFPIVTILYFAFPKKLRNAWLLIVSYFFYMNWNAAHGLLLLGSTVITYLCSLLVEWAKVKRQSVKLAKVAMAAPCIPIHGIRQRFSRMFVTAPTNDVQKEAVLFFVTTYTLPIKLENAAAAMDSVSMGM